MTTITYGETLTITATAIDDDGLPVAIGAGWSAACAVSHAYTAESLISAAMSISGGSASATFDTGDSPWTAGKFRYDIRITDPAGNDYWLPVQDLVLAARITGAS